MPYMDVALSVDPLRFTTLDGHPLLLPVGTVFVGLEGRANGTCLHLRSFETGVATTFEVAEPPNGCLEIIRAGQAAMAAAMHAERVKAREAYIQRMAAMRTQPGMDGLVEEIGDLGLPMGNLGVPGLMPGTYARNGGF